MFQAHTRNGTAGVCGINGQGSLGAPGMLHYNASRSAFLGNTPTSTYRNWLLDRKLSPRQARRSAARRDLAGTAAALRQGQEQAPRSWLPGQPRQLAPATPVAWHLMRTGLVRVV